MSMVLRLICCACCGGPPSTLLGKMFTFFAPSVRSTTRFFFSSRRRHTRCYRDWSSDVCSSDLFVLVVGDEVEQVYVAASHRGTGVADTLMTEAERQITRAGHSTASGPVIVRITPERPDHADTSADE